MPTTEEVAARAIAVYAAAQAFTVTDDATYNDARARLGAVKALEHEVNEAFTPLCQSAYDNWQRNLAQRRKYLEPLAAAEERYKAELLRYDGERERERQIAEAMLRAEAEQEAYAERQRAAEALKEAGALEEAAEVLAQPVIPAPVIVPKSSTVTTRSQWYAEVTDLYALIRFVATDPRGREYVRCLEANLPELNRLATRLKQRLSVPGVEARKRDVVVGS